MSDTPITDAHKGYLSEYGCFLRDPRFGHIVQVGLSRDLERVVQQMAEALTELHASVDRFCSEQGEWDFYTGDAVNALAAWRAFEEKYRERS